MKETLKLKKSRKLYIVAKIKNLIEGSEDKIEMLSQEVEQN